MSFNITVPGGTSVRLPLKNKICDQDVIITATGGGGGGGIVGDADLPSGYKRVGYIQFDAAQVVDTGIICTQDTKIKVVFTRETSSSAYIYGVVNDGNTASVTSYLGGNWRFGSKAVTVTPATSEDLIQTAIQSKAGVDRITAANQYSGVESFTATGTLVIGAARNANGSVNRSAFIGKIFLFEMYSGSKLVLKLVPVTDGAVYRFWDTVGKEFHDSFSDTPLEGGNL